MGTILDPEKSVDLYGKRFDIIIVGAGAAGCILAARLSENPKLKIALIEAGDDLVASQVHSDLLDPLPIAYGVEGRGWIGLSADITIDPSNKRIKKFNQGRGLGGGSTINGSFAFRGQPEDYDSWALAGAKGWDWESVVPFFKKLETDIDMNGPLHGKDGPMLIRREARSSWSPFSEHMAEELEKQGYQWLEDYNGEFQDGYSSSPMANLPERRILTATAYLTREVRGRSNLTIVTNAEVRDLLFEGLQATGVRFNHLGEDTRILASEVILSCGAIFTPALLQRSGIGSAERLKKLGIEVKADLKGVGNSLKNHPKIDLPFHLPKASRQDPRIRSIGQICARISSNLSGCRPHDLGVLAINRSSWHALGHQIGALMLALYQPKSSGHVHITTPNGKPDEIDIDFALLSHEDDFERMRTGLILALQILASGQSNGTINTVFMPNQQLVAKLQKHTRINAFATQIIGQIFSSRTFRELVIRNGIIDPTTLARDPQRMDHFIRQHTNLSHHVCSTCKMGSDHDPDAVLTADCRVRGIAGLRVVDASIFPDIPRAGMFVPVMMAAEKMADRIKQDWSAR